MYQFLLLGYEFLTEFVPFFIAFTLFKRHEKRPNAPFSRCPDIYIMAFVVYIMAVYHVTGAGTIYNAMTFRFHGIENRINLVPFSNPINIIVYLLNVVMFIPFGFLVPLIWRQMGKLSHIVAAGLAFSLLIEVSQLLNVRGADVDDLILNTAGAVIGFLVYQGWDALTKSKYQLSDVATKELPLYILVIYLGRCLLFDYLGLIKLLYGF